MASDTGDSHSATVTIVEHGNAGAHDPGFPPFDSSTFASQLLWLAITFGALYYLMSRLALPRIGSILETRRDRIENDLAQAENHRRETDEAIAAYEQARAEARAKAQTIAQDTRDALRAETDRRRSEIEASLQEKLTAADTRIAEITAAAMAEIDTIAIDTTEAVVDRLSPSTVEVSQIKQAVERVLGARPETLKSG